MSSLNYPKVLKIIFTREGIREKYSMARISTMTIIFIAVIFTMFSCNEESDSSIHTICSCSQNVGMQRIEYLYAIYGTDCCNSRPDKNTPALHVVWSNASGAGWAQQTSERLPGKKAQKAGCKLEDVVIRQGDFENMKAVLRLNEIE